MRTLVAVMLIAVVLVVLPLLFIMTALLFFAAALVVVMRMHIQNHCRPLYHGPFDHRGSCGWRWRRRVTTGQHHSHGKDSEPH